MPKEAKEKKARPSPVVKKCNACQQTDHMRRSSAKCPFRLLPQNLGHMATQSEKEPTNWTLQVGLKEFININKTEVEKKNKYHKDLKNVYKPYPL